MQEIEYLEPLESHMVDLIKIDISRNHLSNIELLHKFTQLKVINASDNFIRSIDLNLHSLQELDLRNNFIE